MVHLVLTEAAGYLPTSLAHACGDMPQVVAFQELPLGVLRSFLFTLRVRSTQLEGLYQDSDYGGVDTFYLRTWTLTGSRLGEGAAAPKQKLPRRQEGRVSRTGPQASFNTTKEITVRYLEVQPGRQNCTTEKQFQI